MEFRNKALLYTFWIPLLLFTGITTSQVCPTGTLHYVAGNICFWLVKLEGTFHEGETNCDKDGGHLANIRDSTTLDFIIQEYKSVLESGLEMYTGYWIGVSDSEKEGQFKTMEGELQTWTFWKTGDPNDPNDPALPQDCVRMFPKGTPPYSWQDRSCTEKAFAFCSKEIVITTTMEEITTTTLGTTTTTSGITTTTSGITTTTSGMTTTTSGITTTTSGITTTTSGITTTNDDEFPTTVEVTTRIRTSTAKTEIPTTDRHISTGSPTAQEQTTTSSTDIPVKIVTSSVCDKSNVTTTKCCSNTNLKCDPNSSNSTCYCTCSPFLSADDPVVLQKIKDLVNQLTISKKNTSGHGLIINVNYTIKKLKESETVNLHRRKYISVADNRPSARGIGFFGAAILASVVASIVMLDLSTVFGNIQHVTLKARRENVGKQTNWAIKLES